MDQVTELMQIRHRANEAHDQEAVSIIDSEVSRIADRYARKAQEAKERNQRIARVQKRLHPLERIIQDQAHGVSPEWAHIIQRGGNYEATCFMEPDDWRRDPSFNFALANETPDIHRALIAVARNHGTGEITGFQAVAIDEQGKKAWPKSGMRKKSLGVIKGAGVYLSGWGNISDTIGLCEGWEDGLCIKSRGFSHVVACLSAGGIASFPLLDQIQNLWVFPDGDQAGLKAANQVHDRYEAAGRAVTVRPAPAGQDWGGLAA